MPLSKNEAYRELERYKRIAWTFYCVFQGQDSFRPGSRELRCLLSRKEEPGYRTTTREDHERAVWIVIDFEDWKACQDDDALLALIETAVAVSQVRG